MSDTRNLKAFWKDESGVLLAETLLLLPLLLWGFVALFIYWDVFRTMNSSQKAAYSIADLMSRQSEVTPAYIDGLENVLDFLTAGSSRSEMRITSLQYDGLNDQYVVLFSRSTDASLVPYNNGSIQALKPAIPIMAPLDSVVIVETEVDYVPRFNTGILNFAPGVGNSTFRQFIVTRPRFYRRICMTNPVCPPDPPAPPAT
jgi:Flp pilus assembly protein TadG